MLRKNRSVHQFELCGRLRAEITANGGVDDGEGFMVTFASASPDGEDTTVFLRSKQRSLFLNMLPHFVDTQLDGGFDDIITHRVGFSDSDSFYSARSARSLGGSSYNTRDVGVEQRGQGGHDEYGIADDQYVDDGDDQYYTDEDDEAR